MIDSFSIDEKELNLLTLFYLNFFYSQISYFVRCDFLHQISSFQLKSEVSLHIEGQLLTNDDQQIYVLTIFKFIL